MITCRSLLFFLPQSQTGSSGDSQHGTIEPCALQRCMPAPADWRVPDEQEF